MTKPVKFRCLDNSNDILFIVSTNTRASTNASTGALVIHKGGLSIDSTENAVNSSVGGSLTVRGGAAFGQDIKIGGGITVGNINFTGTLYQNSEPYLGSQWTTTAGNVSYTSGSVIVNDLETINFSTGNLVVSSLNLGISSVFSGSFSASNDVSTPTDVTDFVFDSSITAFNSNLIVNIDATENLYENFTLSGNKTDNGWNLYVSSIGDSSGIAFTITSGGQLQYTSSNVSGFISSTFRYSCTQINENGTYTPMTPSTSGNYLFKTLQITGTQQAVAGSETGSLLVQGGITVNKNIVTTGLYTTNGTIGQLNVTNVSSGTFIASSATVPQFVATNITAGTLNVGSANLSGPVQITNTTDSSTTSTGALIVSGGVGVSGKIHANEAHLGTTVISGDLTVTGSTITLQSETQVIKDNLIVLNSEPDGVYDSGIMINLTTGSYATMFYDTVTEHFHFAHTSSDPGASTVDVEYYIGLRGQHVDIMGDTNAIGVGTGGSLTTLGGASIGKDLYVGGGLIALGTNRLGALITTGGNVGIGTSTPSFKLDINGNGDCLQIKNNNTGVTLRLEQDSNHSLITRFVNFNNNFWDIQSNTDNSFSFDYNDSERMRISSGGNVGIGTSNPNAFLHFGSLNVSPRIMLYGNDTANSYHGLGININSIQITVPNTGSHFIAFGSNTGGNFSEHMRITNNGNIGIGTNNPNDKIDILNGRLHLFNSTGSTITHSALAFVENAAGFGQYFSQNYTSMVRGVTNNAWSGHILYLEDTGIGQNTVLRIGNNFSEDFIIRASHHTIEPNQQDLIRVSVSSMGIIQMYNSVQNRKLVLFSDANNEHQFYGLGYNEKTLRYQVSSTTAAHRFFAASGSGSSNQIMTILGSGNVGINTSNPSTKLHIVGSGDIMTLQATETNERSTILFDTNGYDWEMGAQGSTSDIPNVFYFLNKEINEYSMIIASNGNIGIGTTAPSNRLHVIGSIQIGNQVISSTEGGTIVTSSRFASSGDIFPNFGGGTANLGFENWHWNNVRANSFVNASDPTIKYDITPLTYGLNSLLQINPIKYKLKSNLNLPEENPQRNFEYYGFNAQELDEIFPELIFDEGEILALDYREIIPVNTQAIKDLHKELSDSKLELELLINFIKTQFPNELQL
jgi:hypothetical protein